MHFFAGIKIVKSAYVTYVELPQVWSDKYQFIFVKVFVPVGGMLPVRGIGALRGDYPRVRVQRCGRLGPCQAFCASVGMEIHDYASTALLERRGFGCHYVGGIHG